MCACEKARGCRPKLARFQQRAGTQVQRLPYCTIDSTISKCIIIMHIRADSSVVHSRSNAAVYRLQQARYAVVARSTRSHTRSIAHGRTRVPQLEHTGEECELCDISPLSCARSAPVLCESLNIAF